MPRFSRSTATSACCSSRPGRRTSYWAIETRVESQKVESLIAKRLLNRSFDFSTFDFSALLLNAGGTVHLLEDQGIKDGEDVLAVGEDALDGGMVPGVTKRQALPALEHLRRDVNIPPELFERVAAQKKPVEKRRLVPG